MAPSVNTVASTNQPVTKVSLPSGMQMNNVFLPINNLGNLVQLIPPSNNVGSANNPGQMPRNLIPPMPSSLMGQRTVGYIVTPNSGVARGQVPNLVSNQNQRLQTFFVRVTNPPNATTMNSIRTTVPRPALPQTSNSTVSTAQGSGGLVLYSRTARHPAPFPQMPAYPINAKLKSVPPKPSLKGSRAANGIVLSWNIHISLSAFAEIVSYQLYAYPEAKNVPINPQLWKFVGNVKALPLPMACTMTQFAAGHRYFFTVRAVDVHSRYGPFSDAVAVVYS